MQRDMMLSFDTETTSNKPDTTRVLQLGAVVTYLDSGEDRVISNTLCNPGVGISPEAQAVHGISQEMVEGKPSDEEAVRELCEFIYDHKDRLILAGHNAITFDDPIIWRISGMPRLKLPIIDTLVCATRTLPDAPSHKLGDLITHLNLGSAEGAHDAMADITMVQNLVKFFTEGLKKNHVELAEWVAVPRVLKTAHFGKFKGRLWGKAPDPSKKGNYVPWHYAKFVADNFTDPSPDLVATIRDKYGIKFKHA